MFLVPAGDRIEPQKASFFMNSSSVLVNDNIQDIDAFNYAHGGKPPKEL